MDAKLSDYQSGSPRFGYRDPEPFDRSVKRYFLSSEELEKYRNGEKGGSKYMTEAEYLKMKEEGMSNRKIADKMGISEGTLYNRIKMWKQNNRQKPKKAHEEEKEVLKVNSHEEEKNSKFAEYESLISELKSELSNDKKLIKNLQSKIAEYENISAACEDVENEIVTLREENGKLTDQVRKYDAIIENQKYQLGQFAKQNEELLEEVKHLKYFANKYMAAV